MPEQPNHKQVFAKEILRARHLWRRYPILILTSGEELPEWIRKEQQPETEMSTPGETALSDEDLITPVDASGLDAADDITNGAYQILRPLLSYEVIDDSKERAKAWASYLPALLDRISWADTELVAIAAAMIHSAHDANTPFEWFVKELLNDARYRSRTYDEVYRRVVDDPDGNMRERWEALIRADKLIHADFPDGVAPITEPKPHKEGE